MSHFFSEQILEPNMLCKNQTYPSYATSMLVNLMGGISNESEDVCELGMVSKNILLITLLPSRICQYTKTIVIFCKSFQLTLLPNFLQIFWNYSSLVSGHERIFVHTAIIRNISKFVKHIFSSFSLSDEIVIILPASPPFTLQNLVNQ